MNKDQIILESLYMEITNMITHNFGNSYKRDALEIFRKYGEVREGDDADDYEIEGVIWNFLNYNWSYDEDDAGNVDITRHDLEDDTEDDFDSSSIMDNIPDQHIFSPEEFLAYVKKANSER
jgi:hypothetical protein